MTTTGTEAAASGTLTGTPTGGRWVSVIEAVTELGVSERSVRRGIASGKLHSAIQDGRRVVLVPGEPDTTSGGGNDRQASGGGVIELKPDTSGGVSGGELAIRQAVEMIVTHQTGQLRDGLRRARRAAAWGWSLTAAAGILLAAGAVWGVQAVEQAKGKAGAADALRAVLVDDLARERDRAGMLANQLRAARRVQAVAVDREADSLVGVSIP